MDVSLRGLVEIASHEGIVPYPYFDSVGVATWGIGHAEVSGRPPNPRHMEWGKASSLKDVFRVFKEDMAAFSRDVNRAVKVSLKQHAFDALVSFHYNTGGIFRASVTKYVNRGDMRRAADAFMLWRRPPEIIGRRRKEMSLFRNGTYTSGGYAPVFRATKSGRVIWSSRKRINVLAQLGGGDLENEPITAVLRPGSVGMDVMRLQKALRIGADGIFGPITKAAVIDYQRDNSLLVDGIAGPQTLGALGLA